jgi:hypothetical protein
MSISTEQLIAQAKEAADLTNVVDYVTDTQWVSWLNDGVRELHRLVTNKFQATYFRTFDFTLTAGQSQVTLPFNFWKLKGLDIDAGTPRRREVRPLNFGERNRIRQNNVRDLATWANDRVYMLLGSSLLKIEAEEQAAGAYRAYYVPTPKLLSPSRVIARNVGVDAVTAGVGPSGEPSYFFTNFGLDFDASRASVNTGDLFSISGASNGANNGFRGIVRTTAATTAQTFGTAVNETFGAGVVATLFPCLDLELEPFSEYVWLTASIKSLIKEESFAQAKELKEQRNLIRADLLEALAVDSGGPATVIDTDDDDWSDW